MAAPHRHEDSHQQRHAPPPYRSSLPPNLDIMGGDIPKRLCVMKDQEDDEAMNNKRIEFLGGFHASFKEQSPPDVQLIPSRNGPPVLAHKAVLAARSNRMKECLDRETLPLSSTDGMTAIAMYEERELVEAFVDFMYSGSLPREKLQKLVTQLFIMAYQYEIEYLSEVCLHHMLVSLKSSNALDFLAIGNVYDIDELEEAALGFILKNMKEVVFSNEYYNFASRYPELCVWITRRFVDANGRVTGV